MAEPIPEKEIEGAYELPEGWVWVRLRDVIDNFQPGFACGARDDRGYVQLRMNNIGLDGKVVLDKTLKVPTEKTNMEKYNLRTGDILFNNTNSVELIGKTVLFRDEIEDCVFSNHITRIRIDTRLVNSELLLNLFINDYNRGIFRMMCHRFVGQAGISRKKLLDHTLPLPPLAEQRRITAKLEALLAQVNAAKEHLAAVPPLIKRFRQSVLAAACSGRLTEDWRREHPDVEPARKLIEEILQGRLSQANTPTKKQKIKDIYSHREEQDSDLLPRSWDYVTLGQLCESFQYGSSKKSMPEGKIPVLRMGNIQNGEIDWNNLVYTSDEWEIEKYRLEPGTVLFNRTNSPELVGKTAIYRGERPAIFAGYLIKINNYKELNSEYLNYCLNSTHTKKQCLNVKTDGVSQSNINAQKLGKFKIPFCPLEEQEEIVRHIDALFKVINSIEYHYKKANAQIDNLAQSILAKAFRGELVPQDPDDEPASVLLERIRKERTELKKKKKPQKRRSKTLSDSN